MTGVVMVRRKWVLAILLAATVAGSAVVASFWPSGPRPCRAKFEQVERGMSFDQVVATVGGPPGTYTHRPYLKVVVTALSHRIEVWSTDDARLVVYFDQSGRADMIHLDDPLPDDRSFGRRVWDRLRI